MVLKRKNDLQIVTMESKNKAFAIIVTSEKWVHCYFKNKNI